MKRGAGKAKGSAFERDVAKALSLWLTRGTDSTQLILSVLSGGWSHGHKAPSGFRQVGDLAPNGPFGEAFRREYAVECKHRRSIDLYGVWTRSAASDDLKGWWKKICEDSEAAGVMPMLIWRQNGRPIMVAMEDIHRATDGDTGMQIWFDEPGLPNMHVMLFSELLKCDPAHIVGAAV